MTQDEILKKLSDITYKVDNFTKESGLVIHKNFIPNGHPNNPEERLKSLLSINFHYTENDRPTATDIMNANWFSRPYSKDNIGNYIEKDKSSFKYGSTHMIFDNDSGTICLPLYSASWAVGDKRLPKTNGYYGYQPISKLFGYIQNYKSLNIEMCNNDIIKNSDEDWLATVKNAKEFVIWLIKQVGLTVDIKNSCDPQKFKGPIKDGEILLLRHYDLTGKICPKPMVDNPKQWIDFIEEIYEKTK